MDKITEKLKALPAEANYFSLEFFPPKTTAGFQNILPRLTRLASLRPLFITVTWGAGGSTAAKSLDLAEIIQRQMGLTTCLHLTCTNMRKRILDRTLTRCKEIGVRNILALRGDEPRESEYEGMDAAIGQPGFEEDGEDAEEEEEDIKFVYAVDLVRYIRRKHGDWFCIGVAAYPEGHTTSPYSQTQSTQHDLPYLIGKTRAGADFIMTQLFYDVEAFVEFRRMLRNHESRAFEDLPIIPGLMPIQSWGVLTRVTKLTCTKVPKDVLEALRPVKGDDAAVKDLGVKVQKDIISKIHEENQSNLRTSQLALDPSRRKTRQPQGFHFYTLNLEKAVARILEECHLIAPRDNQLTNGHSDSAIDDSATPSDPPTTSPDQHTTKDRRRLSSNNSVPQNRVIVPRPASSDKTNTQTPNAKHTLLEAPDDEAGVPCDKNDTSSTALAISEGQGTRGREATWDDYPNGRFGDARSPAYGSIDGYGPTIHFPPSTARRLWLHPRTRADVTALFHRYLTNDLSAIPWSEESLSAETGLIRAQLLRMTERGWWTVASQPAVNAAESGDRVVGWGPLVGGWVWQKPFVEFFAPGRDWRAGLKARLDERAARDEITYFAGDAAGAFVSSDERSVNPVTWGAFRGKEIRTPTLIEAVSFRAWQDEAFDIWREWARVYDKRSASFRLLAELLEDVWLVNVIGHEYADGGDSFWDALLGG